LKPERLGKAARARVGDRQRARVGRFFYPTQIETATEKRGADRARDVRPPFAPIEAGAAKWPPRAMVLVARDAEIDKEPGAGFGNRGAVVAEEDVSSRRHRVRDADADAARQVIVTDARHTHPFVDR
jgi:hypothetical protein